MRHLSSSQILLIERRFDQLAEEWNDELTSERPNWWRLVELDDQMAFIEVVWSNAA